MRDRVLFWLLFRPIFSLARRVVLLADRHQVEMGSELREGFHVLSGFHDEVLLYGDLKDSIKRWKPRLEDCNKATKPE